MFILYQIRDTYENQEKKKNLTGFLNERQAHREAARCAAPRFYYNASAVEIFYFTVFLINEIFTKT